MKTIVLDFETFYSDEFSLTRMATEDYVTDPRFQIILVAAKVGNQKTEWMSGSIPKLAKWFDDIDLWNSCVVCHNMMFDGLILAKHFGKLPKIMLCTRFMANAVLKPHIKSVSLANCLNYLQLGVNKGDAVKYMKGKTIDMFTKVELYEYAQYCITDCDGTYALFKYMIPFFPKSELQIIDRTLRMYLEPQFTLDAKVFAATYAESVNKKETLLAKLESSGVTRDILMSNQKFAALLKGMGVDVPLKTSPTTGNLTYAFAKTDPGWKDLEEEYHDDPTIGPMLMARIGVKTSIEETRSKRLLDIANTHGKLRIPLLYYSAHTGRYGGTEKINAQNFPRVDKSRMRFGITAPKGHVIIAADLSQIEARMTAWLAGEKDLLKDFANGVDIYSKFATRIFGREVKKGRSKDDDRMRFVGKTCILGLGFGMSGEKLALTLRKDNMDFTVDQCIKMVYTYRQTYPFIPEMWSQLNCYMQVMGNNPNSIQTYKCLGFARNTIILPNNMTLAYPKLTLDSPPRSMTYKYASETRTLWGGKVAENCVQALARIVVMDQMLNIERTLGLKLALQQHDELDYIVPEAEADSLVAEIKRIMSIAPSWAPDLPVAVEVNYGPTLGHCK